MLAWHRTIVLLVLASSMVRAQLILENPKHLDLPDEQARVLFLTTTRVMETEFHSPGALENTFRLRLVLGEKSERFTIDDPAGNGTLYLEKWNEGKFALAAMHLAIQHLLAPDRQKRLFEEIVRRTHEIAPVKATQLRKEPVPSVVRAAQDDCIGTITNAAARSVNCGNASIVPRPSQASRSPEK